MQIQPHFYFCFPYLGTGGISLLFLRLGEYLADILGVKVTLIDYESGYMAKHITSKKITLLPYSIHQDCQVPANAILVLQSMNPWSIFPRLKVHRNARLILWNCLPFNLVPALPGLRNVSYRNPFLLHLVLKTVLAKRRKLNAEFVKSLYAKRAIFFQDYENVTVTQSALGLSIPDPILLPIPGPRNTPPLRGKAATNNNQSLRVVWVGRIADFKASALIRILKDLDRVTSESITVTIVGTGDFEQSVRKCTEGLAHIRTEFVGEISPSKLQSFLLKNADLFIGMGTAALEAARLGIPTILLDISYGPITSAYQYRWFHEEKDYTLGRVLYGEKSYPPGKPVGRLLEELRENPHIVAQNSQNHYKVSHSLSRVAVKFLANAEQAQYYWRDLEDTGANRRDLTYRILVKMRNIFRGGGR